MIKYLFAILLCILSLAHTTAQPGLPLEQDLQRVTIDLPVFSKTFPLLQHSPHSPEIEEPLPLNSLLLAPLIPAAYNFDHLGFFCKFEVQLERKAHLPVKFRLGEVQYTEWLEYGDPR